MKNRPDHASAAVAAPVRPRISRRDDAERPVPLVRPVAEQLARLVPAAVLMAVAGALAWQETGSIAARDWLPYALMASLVVVTALVTMRSRPARAGLISLGLLFALAAFDAVSYTWSASPSLARDEGLLVLFYVLALAAALISIREQIDRAYAVGLVAFATSALAVASAVHTFTASDPTDDFFGGRLDFPISYVNAQAAFMLIGLWPALATAARRTAPVLVRALALGGAVSLLCGWLMTQSKGGALGLLLSAIVVFAVARDRLRLAVPALVTVGLAAVGAVALTAPIRAHSDGALRHAIHRGAGFWLLLSMAGFAIGGAYALVDRRLELTSRGRRGVGRLARVAVIAALVAGAAAFVVHERNPISFVSREWASFKRNPTSADGSSTHLFVLGSNRYDFWRVALGRFKDDPLVGVGARGFGPAYLLDRQSGESPARAHSLQLDVLSETGLLGFALLALALGIPLLAAARRARMELAGAGAFGAAVYFLGHASVDWIWTFPAVGVPFFFLLGTGAGSGIRREHRLSLRAALPAAAVVLLLGLVAFGAPWLSSRFNVRALKGGAGAASDIAWAKRLDPLSTDPWISESLLAPTPQAALPSLEHAAAMEPRNYALHYLLGFAYLRAGDTAGWERELVRAYQLDPKDPLVAAAVPQPVVPSAPARPPRGG